MNERIISLRGKQCLTLDANNHWECISPKVEEGAGTRNGMRREGTHTTFGESESWFDYIEEKGFLFL